MEHTPAASSDRLAAAEAEIARLDATKRTEDADKAIVLAVRGMLTAFALRIGHVRTAQAFHREAWPDGGGLIPDEALVTGTPTTNGPAARALFRVLCQLAEPVIGVKTAELLAGATTRIDADAKAVTVLTEGGAKNARGTPDVREHAVMVIRVLASRIQAKAKKDGAKEWSEALKLTDQQLRSVEEIELALLRTTGRQIDLAAWRMQKQRQPPALKIIADVLAAEARGKPLTLKQREAIDEDAKRFIQANVVPYTDPARLAATLMYLGDLRRRGDRK
jgi:hypothetical protein